MMQAKALGIVKNVAEIREVTGRSFPSVVYKPSEYEIWDKAFEMYKQITCQV
jgi:hypothetical protein